MKLNLLIITYNSIKILYESIISSILLRELKDFCFDWFKFKDVFFFCFVYLTLFSLFLSYINNILLTQSKYNYLQEQNVCYA